MGLLTMISRRRRRLFWVLACFLLVSSFVAYIRIPRGKLEDDFYRLDVAFRGDHISYDNMIQFKLGEELLSETEKAALQTVISPDLPTESSRETSTLHLVHRSGKPSEPMNVTVRLDLRDGNGRKVEYGGHQIRMWITSVPADEKSASLRVKDLRNGSYVATFPALWPGKTVVHAALIFSRDLHYVMSKTIVNLKNPQPLVGGFVRGDCKEATLCGPFPVIPGYPASCNHTSMNSGIGWYCGKPTVGCLSCEDLKLARRLKLRGFPRTFQTVEEQNLYSWYKSSMKDKRWKFDMKQTLTINLNTRPLQESRVPCSAIKPRDTWIEQSPHGFYDKQRWHRLDCTPSPRDMASLENCFRGAKFWFIGDSNARMMFEAMCIMMEGYIDKYLNKGHSPLQCERIRPDLDMEVAWYPHEYPFQGSKGIWYNLNEKKSVRYRMDRIPSTGKYILLVHLLVHFVNYPTAVYTEHVKDVVRGARDLCRRNPSAKIVVRGPSCWVNEIRGDYLTTMATDVLKREFRELQDCVIYLDSWDVTLAAGGCNNVHPPVFAAQELSWIFLDHVC